MILQNWSNRDKAILVSLFLSKFDRDAINNLGFSNFTEAFNVIGFTLETKPMSIKNYRDEFDPYFSNNRVGRHNRNMRPNCAKIYEGFKDLSFKEFAKIVLETLQLQDDLRDFNISTYEAESFDNQAFAKRLITGKAAEEYFRLKYKDISIFENYELIDTTQNGCGFDFKLRKEDSFWGIEVKGISNRTGGVQMTEKEYKVAQLLKNQYCLFVVKNFQEIPFHEYFINPTNGNLNITPVERTVKQVSWNVHV